MGGFLSYEKMHTSLKKLNLSEGEYAKIDRFKWVVTEKIHGANFSFVYKAKSLKFAKRKEFLSWKDDFFGFQLVVANMEDRIIELFENLSNDFEGDTFIIYGELFGGAYPHPDVVKNNKVQAIQTGVYYSPAINFSAFDIAFVRKGVKHYLDYETSVMLFSKYGIKYAKPLLVSKFREAVSFNIKINSTIPKTLNLPELPDNLIEGVVIKPYDQKPENALSDRPIIKLKNPDFEEDQKFHKAQKWSFIPNVSSSSVELTYIVMELQNYVTVNRLESAISKIGALDFDNSQRISDIEQEFLQDTLVDFNQINDGFLNELDEEQLKWISDRIKADIQHLIISKKKDKK